MFLDHWAATEPRETVVSWVRSESGSDDRRSITRQNRDIAASASRRFWSSPDGVGEAVLLGAGDEATGVTEMPGWESASLQLPRPATRLNTKTHSAKRPSPVRTTHLPTDPPSPKGSFGSWRSKDQQIFDDANRAARMRNPGERLADNRSHPDTSPQSGEAPELNRCGWSGPLAYKRPMLHAEMSLGSQVTLRV